MYDILVGSCAFSLGLILISWHPKFFLGDEISCNTIIIFHIIWDYMHFKDLQLFYKQHTHLFCVAREGEISDDYFQVRFGKRKFFVA